MNQQPMSKAMKVYLGIAGWVLSIIALTQSALMMLSIKGSWGDIAVLAGVLLIIMAGALTLFGINKGAELLMPSQSKDDEE